MTSVDVNMKTNYSLSLGLHMLRMKCCDKERHTDADTFEKLLRSVGVSVAPLKCMRQPADTVC